MKAVILAGGYGTRISEESGIRPKPMVEVGGHPILWHIMKTYSHYGINDFIICCGYKSYLIKDYFANYHLRNSDITFDLASHTMEIHKNGAENWKVTLVETGESTMTGGRIKRVKDYIGNETFCLTYGDGVSDINIGTLINFHRKEKALATLTAVQPPGRFGAFTLEEGQKTISSFMEKPRGDGAWINGGYFVLEPEVFNYIEGDETIWEQEPMRKLANEGKLAAYRHNGFWQNMDTLRDKNLLEDIWQEGQAPWKIWK
ncbi:glucose-1-phosphate cytidylyltransferase [Candidatus Gottesmanbacteria bacterium]|nr:glucose-1-phosphate cytidylyltransferase [Candidatus Gottesmanbacteria bacterium]